MNEQFIDRIICGDTMKILPQLDSNSVDVVLTDPPYFLDKLDNAWDPESVADSRNQQVVRSLPSGMRFDRKQGQQFYTWYLDVSRELLRILKPGGLFFSFSSPRLYHRMACAMDDAGFELRDMFLWLYTQNQVKAMGLNHFIEKLDVDDKTKRQIKRSLTGWKTPQLKSCFEPIAMGQKPVDETYLNNMLTHQVGLVDTKVTIGQSMHPANVVTIEPILDQIDRAFLLSKPTKQEKGNYNDHKTVKPLTICEYLIRLSAFANDAVILDPFVGSGTTAVAAKQLGHHYIGIELNKQHIDIAERRLQEANSG